MSRKTENGIINLDELIERAYKSRLEPDFSFVKKSASKRPYERLIRVLRDYAAVEETTESEDDVCFSYLLKGRANLWKLDLSMVGPVGIFVRLKAAPSREDFLTKERGDLVDFERKICDILMRGKVRLLSAGDLEKPLDLNLFNTPRGETTMYQGLFCDRPGLPWV